MNAAVLRWGASLVLAALSALAIASELPRIAPSESLWDFGSFVASGRAAREGLNPYGIYPLTLRVELPGFESWNPNLNPPISALLFQVFDAADPHLSFRVWRWISVAFYVATVIPIIWRYRCQDNALVLGLWTFALAGFWDTLFLGQIYLPLVFATVVAWLLLERGATVWAGILIGMVVAMKPNFLVWPVLLFLAGHRVPALASIGTAAIIGTIPVAVFGFEVYRQWFQLLASDEGRSIFLTNASLTGLASRAGASTFGLSLSLALLAVLAAWAFFRRPDTIRASALALVASLLASPLGWVQYTLFLLPVFLSHWDRPAMRLAGLLLIIPVPFVISYFTAPAWEQFTIGSIYAWALILCLGVLFATEWRREQGRSPMPPASGAGRTVRSSHPAG